MGRGISGFAIDGGLWRRCRIHPAPKGAGILLAFYNAKDFEPLHRTHDHAGILLYYEQPLPDNDPEGLARTVDKVFTQYGSTGIENELVDLDEWYDWVPE